MLRRLIVHAFWIGDVVLSDDTGIEADLTTVIRNSPEEISVFLVTDPLPEAACFQRDRFTIKWALYLAAIRVKVLFSK